MKLDQLDKILNKFIENKGLSAILINGDWGIGKTYKVLSYKQNCKRKDINFLYVSIFGKKSLDEINTVLYNQLHPYQKAINVVSHVVKLVGASVSVSSGVNLSIGHTDTFIKQENHKIKSKKKQIVIICDDLERVGPDIDKNDLVGYFNELILQGIKIIVLANLKQNDNFSEYKEKIFDRVYHITETQGDATKKIMDKYKDLFNEKIAKLINGNLRMLKKSMVLYGQIITYLEKHNLQFDNQEELMAISICIVREVLTNELSSKYVEGMTEEGRKNIQLYPQDVIQTNAICKYLIGCGILATYSSIELIQSVLQIYLEENYSMLMLYYNPVDSGENIFTSLFFDSDENKLKKIKKQYEFILNLKSTNSDINSKIENAICEWYTYCPSVDISFIDEKKLFAKIVDLDIHLKFMFRRTTGVEHFEMRLNNYKTKILKEQITDELNNFEESKAFEDKIYTLHNKYITYDNEIKEVIKENLIKNSFYMNGLYGDISPIYWSIVHCICKFTGEMARELIHKLLQTFGRLLMKYPNDQSLKDRIKGLKEQYNLKIK